MIAHLPSQAANVDAPTELRAATRDDVNALEQLEARCFDSDRLSRRSFRRLIDSETASLLVAMTEDRLAGYVCVLYRRGTALSRIYSIAVDPDFQGRGIAHALMARSEADALAHGCTHTRLEVRPDNRVAIRFYQGLGYKQFAAVDDYYADHSPALRLEKRIRHPRQELRRSIPFYAQTTEFTCGPASLMMAMAALDPDHRLERTEELRLWREATTIFMTSGHGGCGPHGLALAAHNRGFGVTLVVNQAGPLFLDSVRDPDKKAVMTLVHEDFERQLATTPVQVQTGTLGAADLADHLEAGRIPLVLISSWRMNGNKAPHWVTVVAADAHCLYVHDPDVGDELEASATDNAWLPIPRAQFERMARFGRQGLRASLIVGPAAI